MPTAIGRFPASAKNIFKKVENVTSLAHEWSVTMHASANVKNPSSSESEWNATMYAKAENVEAMPAVHSI